MASAGFVSQPTIPGLPDDLALRCLAMVSHGHHGLLKTVSRRWRDLIRSREYACYKAKEGWSGTWLFVLTEQSNNQWVAYDPDADRWHPLPKPSGYADMHHFGFSCVCVNNKLLVIGGSCMPNGLSLPQQTLITDRVLQFDPFYNEWKSMARMRTPRSNFACTVMSGKVFVAGGRNLAFPRGLVLAEVYDPLTDKWEELPPMPNPQMDCLGLSYKGKFHVLGDQVGLSETTPLQIFDPSNKTWFIKEDTWPFSRATQFSVQVIGDCQIYAVIDWGESLIKTRESENGEWYNVDALPPVTLENHTRALEAFGYGFATLKEEVYVMGGKVLKWEEAGNGRFDIVRLDLMRICNPAVRPLNWRQAKPMCSPASGSVLGCTSLEEKCNL